MCLDLCSDGVLDVVVVLCLEGIEGVRCDLVLVDVGITIEDRLRDFFQDQRFLDFVDFGFQLPEVLFHLGLCIDFHKGFLVGSLQV